MSTREKKKQEKRKGKMEKKKIKIIMKVCIKTWKRKK